jgi:type II secretory pathway component PulF
MVVGVVPRFRPIFNGLEAKGELPQLTSWLMAFVQLDTACFHLPVLFVVIALLAIDEAAVSLLRRQARGPLWAWLCLAAVALAAMPAIYLVVGALLLAIFEMGRVK